MAPQGSSWFTVVFFTLQLKLLGPGTLCFCKASEPDVIQQEGPGLELLGFQFLALNPREREVCWYPGSILAWIILDYVTLQQG